MDLPGIRQVLELPLLSSALAGFLPQLVLRLFFSLMPYILAALERVEGLPAESEVEFGVVRKYFAFQVIPTNINHHYPSCHRSPWKQVTRIFVQVPRTVFALFCLAASLSRRSSACKVVLKAECMPN